MKVMYLDESGDHNLSVIDPRYPVFVLGGIIVEQGYAEEVMASLVQQFKMDLFGRVDVILHTADVTRNTNGFERMKEPAFRQEFYDRLNALMQTLQYQVVACAIKKDIHLARHGLAALDPYLLGLRVLVERFCFEVGNQPGGGVLVAEKRNSTLDHELDLAWLELRISGTRFLPAAKIERRIAGLTTRHKRENIAGLQLADLVVSPIGRFVLGKPVKEDFRIIESKFRRSKGTYHGPGLVVLPAG